MIRVDENDPIGEVQLSFPHRNVQIKREIDLKEEYDLLDELGRGKFGIVYRCKEKQSGLNLAAKFINCPKKEDRRNVEREIDIMRSLQHPRLIQLYDAFENGKIMCVILELIEGGELFERVIDDDFILTEKSCTVFMRQICEGVDFIHNQRILHLDMKPENILCLTKTGNRIKIIDFGLARRFDPDKKLQVLFGTPEFVAPEVVNYDAIGYGTDMWSVGVICYVLLSGLSPFMGATDPETMANVTIAKYDFDDEAFSEISENAKDFIRKLLVKDMTKRISAGECLHHDWLKRKSYGENATVTLTTTFETAPSPSMDVTKDNLKLFVERWNEHPNSPYVFDRNSAGTGYLVCSGGHQLTDSSHSLSGLSPSPCGSIASLTSDTNVENDEENVSLLRRASDSQSVIKTSKDVVERINLADEIRKLSDKLYQLSKIPTSLENLETSENVQRNIPIEIVDTNHASEPKWRTKPSTKYNKLNEFSSRDVPMLNFRSNTTIHETIVEKKVKNSTPNSTKNLLLSLLEHWDGPQLGGRRHNMRHSSISSEWTETNFNLGQRTISSLNNFFQSRATTRKITPFHQFKN